MNTQNYASLEASKRLHDAGIVLKTEAYWIRVANSPMMLVDNRHGADEYYPAPSMAEVWRELPHNTWLRKDYIGRTNIMNEDNSFIRYNINPTDALIELLIHIKGAGK